MMAEEKLDEEELEDVVVMDPAEVILSRLHQLESAVIDTPGTYNDSMRASDDEITRYLFDCAMQDLVDPSAPICFWSNCFFQQSTLDASLGAPPLQAYAQHMWYHPVNGGLIHVNDIIQARMSLWPTHGRLLEQNSKNRSLLSNHEEF
jgi:hypothetical protein